MSRPVERVVVRLYGGLGNQLFQYAAGVAVARRLGGIPVIALCDDPYWREQGPGLADVLVRMPDGRTSWDRPAPNAQYRRRRGAFAGSLSRVPGYVSRRVRPSRWIRPEHSFAPLTDGLLAGRDGPELFLDGYFQDATWFGAVIGQVTAELVASMPPWAVTALANRNRPDVAFHFRRTDYSAIGWELGPQYYESALEALPLAEGMSFVVCSDDQHFAYWFARSLIGSGLVPFVLPEPLPGPRSLGDFWLLALSRSIAIANSTFSWWAAAVGDSLSAPATSNEARLVVAPEPWVPSSPRFSAYLADWRRLASGFGRDGTAVGSRW